MITSGEMHRRRHNRHSPPIFWQKMLSFQGETRPKPITQYDPFHPAAICPGPIANAVDLGLVEEFQTASSFARKPIKITMTRSWGALQGDICQRFTK